MITINQDKCTGCGMCVKDCPGSAIKMIEGKANPYRECIYCGHCVAVCPVKAAAIEALDMEGVEEYQADTFALNPKHYLHAVKFRRSIRNFQQKKLPKEVVEQIIEAGRYTATAKNRQELHFTFVQENLEEFKKLFWQELPGIIEKLQETKDEYGKAFGAFYRRWEKEKENDTFFFNTPSILVIAADNPIDIGLAAANMENMAVAEGAGALYSGYLMRAFATSPVLQEWLEIPNGFLPFCMLLGYPAVKYQRTSPRKHKDIIWK